jgi:hypothetical protein
MSLSDDIAIERVALSVIDRSLPKREWTHAGHFAAALWLLRFRVDLTSADAMRNLIMGYNEATNTPNTDSSGYHHTITRASIRAAESHLARLPREALLHDVLRSLMASPLGKPDWLLSYWRRDTLFSVAARRGWVEPDLEKLPW